MNSGGFEPIESIDEYYDGPRSGIAIVGGIRCSFRSRYLDAKEYRGDFESVDLFDLLPLEQPGRPAMVATAEFRPIANGAPRNGIVTLEAKWMIVRAKGEM